MKILRGGGNFQEITTEISAKFKTKTKNDNLKTPNIDKCL